MAQAEERPCAGPCCTTACGQVVEGMDLQPNLHYSADVMTFDTAASTRPNIALAFCIIRSFNVGKIALAQHL